MTLKQKLIGVSVGMVLFLALINFYQFQEALENQRTSALDQIGTHSQMLAERLGTAFGAKYNEVQVLALNEALKTDKAGTPNSLATLNEYVRLNPAYDLVLLVDTRGNYLASNTRSAQGTKLTLEKIQSQNYSDTAWFKNTLGGSFSEDASKGLSGTFVEDAAIDSLSSLAYGANRYGVSFSTLVKDSLSGKVLGVLTARTDFQWAEKEFQEFSHFLKTNGMASAVLTLTNGGGYTLISHRHAQNQNSGGSLRDLSHTVLKENLAAAIPSYASLMKGQSGVEVNTNPSTRTNQVIAFTSTKNSPAILGNLSWGVALAVEESEAFAAIVYARNRFLVIGGGIMFLFAFMAYAFSVAIGKSLGSLSTNIYDTSSQVISGAEQMSSASQSLASTATEAASSLEETVASIDQLMTVVKLNTDHAIEAANLSKASRDSADEGEVEIKKLVSAMGEINESSKKIEDIINVIDDIAFQTNLLALNAAVEAARAGDQGKGFAVVAEEVRNLAQRSAAAAKDITSLIKENVSKIEFGVEIAGNSGTVLQTILTSVRKVADLNGEIASASREQTQGLEQISQAMAQLDQVTQTNAASAEEVASSAEEMSSQGLLMQETVSGLNRLILGSKGTVATHRSALFNARSATRSPSVPGNVIPLRTKTSPGAAAIPFESDGSDDSGNVGSTAGF
jgi:hypothetical protein